MIYTIHYLQTICAMKESKSMCIGGAVQQFFFRQEKQQGKTPACRQPCRGRDPGTRPLRSASARPARVCAALPAKQTNIDTQKMKSHLTGNAIWRCIQQKKNKFITFTQRACTAERYASWIENVHFWLSSTTACKCMPCCKLCLREQWPWGGISRTPRMMCTPYLDQS